MPAAPTAAPAAAAPAAPSAPSLKISAPAGGGSAPPKEPPKDKAPKEPAKPPATPPEDEGGDNGAFDKAFEELDTLDKAIPPEPAKGKGKGKPKEGEATETPETPEDKGGEHPDSEPEDIEAEVDSAPLPRLRKMIKASKTARVELQDKLTKANARIQELEATPPDSGAPDKQTQDRIATLEKTNQELEQRLEFTNYSQSPKFIKEYVEPYQKAWARAVSEVSQLNISYAEGEDTVSRKATQDDLLALANLPLDQLDATAEAWFGPRAANRVIRHIESIRELATKQQDALDEAKKGSEERMKSAKADKDATDGKVRKAYQGTLDSLAKKYPRWFGTNKGDDEGNKLWQKGLEYVDSVFAQNELTGEQKASRMAIIKVKAANHDRLAKRLTAVLKELAEARKSLEEYEASAPPGGGSPPKGKSMLDDAMTELDSLDKKTP